MTFGLQIILTLEQAGGLAVNLNCHTPTDVELASILAIANQRWHQTKLQFNTQCSTEVQNSLLWFVALLEEKKERERGRERATGRLKAALSIWQAIS